MKSESIAGGGRSFVFGRCEQETTFAGEADSRAQPADERRKDFQEEDADEQFAPARPTCAPSGC
jgi:hypothetical protein